MLCCYNDFNTSNAARSLLQGYLFLHPPPTKCCCCCYCCSHNTQPFEARNAMCGKLSTAAHPFLHLAITSTCGRQHTCAVWWTAHKSYVLNNRHILWISSIVVHKKTRFYLAHQNSLTITVVISTFLYNVSSF